MTRIKREGSSLHGDIRLFAGTASPDLAKEIADYLHISINTVKSHLSTIYRILDVTKRTELKERLNL